MSAFSVLTILWLVITIWIGLIGSSDIIGILILCLYYIVIAVCCYFIIRQNPGSVWYVPILRNGLFIFFLSAKPNFPDDPMFWIPLFCGFILTIIVSMLGARRGKKDVIYNNSEIE